MEGGADPALDTAVPEADTNTASQNTGCLVFDSSFLMLKGLTSGKDGLSIVLTCKCEPTSVQSRMEALGSSA